MSSGKPVIITPGDPAGIGPEIALKALANDKNLSRKAILMGDKAHLMTLAASLEIEAHFHEWSPNSPINDDGIHLYPLNWPAEIVAGKPDTKNAPMVIKAIEIAVQLAKDGDVSAVVTCPIAKSVLYETGFRYPGHTEFLGALSSVKADPIMMLANHDLRVVPATIHCALQDVPVLLSKMDLANFIANVGKSLQADFGIEKPHIAICGLNPHAGEDGAMGDEETSIIRPAMEKCLNTHNNSITLSGPHASDSLFHPEKRNSYDCVIGMYHDQVLIPVKTIDFHGSANITLGLDFVRTSPDHGTAFDIAGQNKAHPESLMKAIEIALEIAANRQNDR